MFSDDVVLRKGTDRSAVLVKAPDGWKPDGPRSGILIARWLSIRLEISGQNTAQLRGALICVTVLVG